MSELMKIYSAWMAEHSAVLLTGDYNNHRTVRSLWHFCARHGYELDEDVAVALGEGHHLCLSLYARGQMMEMQTEIVIPRASEFTESLGNAVVN